MPEFGVCGANVSTLRRENVTCPHCLRMLAVLDSRPPSQEDADGEAPEEPGRS
jgi:glutaredoxin